jgi:hypothetical protein
MGMQNTEQFETSTEKQVSLEQFNFNFDLWAKAVKQQMLEALQTGSELTVDDHDQEDLPETLDDESE